MQIYDYNAYEWNRGVAPHGNMGRVDPTELSRLLDKHGIPWYTSGWPYSSGLSAYCVDDELWRQLCNLAREGS